MIDDLRFTIRSWFKSPSFATVAVFTLALGMAAATAIFSVMDSVLLRPLPYPHPDRVVDIREVDEKGRGMRLTEPNFDDLQQQSRSFEMVARYGQDVQAVTGGTEPVRATVCAVSSVECDRRNLCVSPSVIDAKGAAPSTADRYFECIARSARCKNDGATLGDNRAAKSARV